ncbi:MAG TPA: NIPSNAP family protein [Actinocrinis sp.]|uniref:NIPSNAP family protein n=1 Tax=Actinocrinis sp. TaxID=1920516 RepID=UPI002D6F8FD9|nr:NIPSNAP family protein [Actinocrinis sp.]HZU57149.1 NIPSNAP family protein [Actinocrinis sp.]
MILEERNYRLVPGGAARYLAAWHRAGREPQVRHLGEPVGVYTVEMGELNTLVYHWRYADFADRAHRRQQLAADADFAAFRAEVRGLLVQQSNRILLPFTPAPIAFGPAPGA